VLALVTRWRLAGAVLAISTAAMFAALVTSHQFDLAHVQVSDLVYTQQADIDAAVGLPAGATPNVFRIDTTRMARALVALPAVASANVYVALPDRLVVDVTERTPTFVLATPTGAYVLDVDGFVLDEVPVADASSLGLPVITDLRDQFAPVLEVGGRLDAVSQDADLRLAAITPATIGTSYGRLDVTADDTDGYVMTAEPGGWRAIFGHYTPNLRPIDIFDTQVQCLRARVEAGESDLAVIYLAPLDDKCGTFLPRSTPSPSALPS
jgi:POTRA domain, FtsQ-type